MLDQVALLELAGTRLPTVEQWETPTLALPLC